MGQLWARILRLLNCLNPVSATWRDVEMATTFLPSESESLSPEAPVDDEAHPEDAILFVCVSLVLGVICRQLFKGTRVPYTVALLILGVGLGAIEYGTENGLGQLGASIRIWSAINPELILFIFLPALLFESSFAMEVHQIKRCMMQMVLLASFGVAISTACLAFVNHYFLPYGWNWSTCLLLGGLLSATDPVAVVALLKDLGASKKLRTIIEGESLMNDGTAIVVYQLFLQITLGNQFTTGDIIEFFARVSLGGCALGIVFGLVVVFWIGRLFNDTVIEITLTLTASYLAFFVAQGEAQVSGVLAVMTIGMFLATFARTAFTGESHKSIHHFWNMIAYIANTLIFILSGTVIADRMLRSQNRIEARDWAYLVLLYTFLQLSRALVVLVLYPGLKYFGYGINWKEAAILIWAGLRGAVALSLSLSISQVGPIASQEYTLITKQTEAQFVFLTGGVVLLTLVINGTTTQFLLRLLQLDNMSETKGLVLDYVRHEMYRKASESFGELGEDEDLGPADWSTVCQYVTCLGQIGGREAPAHPHDAITSEKQEQILAFQDTRIRFLNGVQAAYWGMLEEGRVTRTAASILMESVDEALDLAARDEPLQDWNGLRPHVHFPQYLRANMCSMFPHKVLTFLLPGQLELGCYLSAAFLRAHRKAQHQLRDFMGGSAVAAAVINESQAEEEGARDFLEDVRLSFPQVLRVIKTKQVTYAVLTHLSSYVTNLEEAGLLEAKETNHLHDIVQLDMKKLQRHPPSVQMPSAHEALSNQPFFGALPSHLQSFLLSSAEEVTAFRDQTLYIEDSKADGIWLIARGNVKWSCEKFKDHYVGHPIFTHGSTLGLYEALTGRPRLCTVTADSVVHCFYIDKAKLMSTLHTEPGLEDFFWQESALIVAKLVIPQQFEAVTVQELRALIMEGSYRTYIRRESIEVELSKIAILLEGFVKQEDRDDVISAPAGLLSLYDDLHLVTRGRRSSLTPQSVFYQAEARCRVLFLDLQSIPPSMPSMCSVLSFQPGREYGDLLRFPSRLSNSHAGLTAANSRSSLKSGDALDNLSASYSARAMEISLFGSSDAKARRRSGKSMYIRNLLEVNNSGSEFYPTTVGRTVGECFLSAHTLVSPPNDRNGHLAQRRVHSQGAVVSSTPLQLPRRQARTRSQSSSDESDVEEDHIVEVASPSSLFNNQHSIL